MQLFLHSPPIFTLFLPSPNYYYIQKNYWFIGVFQIIPRPVPSFTSSDKLDIYVDDRKPRNYTGWHTKGLKMTIAL